MDNIYANVTVDTIKVHDDFNTQTQCVTSSAKSNLLRGAAVCLGLLCVLLLAGIIGVYVHYNRVTGDFEEAQSVLQRKRDQLKAETNDLKRKKDLLGKQFTSGWVHFNSSLYFLSRVKKTWDQSRVYCENMNSSLVIITSRLEQNFIHGLNGVFWIGLSDKKKEGSWKWVDGKDLNLGFWKSGEPNNMNNNEHCAERRFHDANPEESWNDESFAHLQVIGRHQKG
ncbi:hypothetical protein UPYG_G00266030 [Umbra pygmaea]|uniref:C-type lectin domain-containing protein n=1 Tax=Umbra pygmaea TaxID=75934 RepID=A0ABD0W9X4_UMBPY